MTPRLAHANAAVVSSAVKVSTCIIAQQCHSERVTPRLAHANAAVVSAALAGQEGVTLSGTCCAIAYRSLTLPTAEKVRQQQHWHGQDKVSLSSGDLPVL